MALTSKIARKHAIDSPFIAKRLCLIREPPASAWMILCIAATMVAMTSGTARKRAVDFVRRCHIGDDKQNRPQARG